MLSQKLVMGVPSTASSARFYFIFRPSEQVRDCARKSTSLCSIDITVSTANATRLARSGLDAHDNRRSPSSRVSSPTPDRRNTTGMTSECEPPTAPLSSRGARAYPSRCAARMGRTHAHAPPPPRPQIGRPGQNLATLRYHLAYLYFH